MAIKRDAPVQKLDAAVEAATSNDDELRARRDRAIYQKPGERRKADKDRQRNRKQIDLPPMLEKLIDELAAELGTSSSQVAVYLLAKGAQQARMAEMEDARVFTRSMRYEYVLETPDIPRKIKD